MNLRGSIVVPIVDLRRRFELDAAGTGEYARRILVLAVGGGKTGFMVDGVSEVMRVPLDGDPSGAGALPEQMRLISRVANLDAEGRMILLVDPAQLLDQVEADVSGQVRPRRSRAGIDGFVIKTSDRRRFRADAEVARRDLSARKATSTSGWPATALRRLSSSGRSIRRW